ncbi:MAG: class I SAM-dependent methyltransferase [Bacteroidota bacterium]
MADYDHIAEDYKASKALPFRTHVEAHTLFALLGDVRGLRVLDLACGEGIYTRQVMRLGAAEATGVDLSPAMIGLAEREEALHPLGCTYRTHDARTLGTIGAFDVVLGVYLLNYAPTYDDLLAFCRTIYANLRPGGRFVGFNDNVANSPAHYASYRPYGFVKRSPPERYIGAPITYTLFNADGTVFDIVNYYLPPEQYEAAFREAGFTSFNWQGPWLSEDGAASFPEGYWTSFFADPPLIGLLAKR